MPRFTLGVSMEDDRATITAEYQDGFVRVMSTEPLTGTLELMGDNDEMVELSLDRDSAEALIAVLVDFLDKGEGGDAPRGVSPSLQ